MSGITLLWRELSIPSRPCVQLVFFYFISVLNQPGKRMSFSWIISSFGGKNLKWLVVLFETLVGCFISFNWKLCATPLASGQWLCLLLPSCCHGNTEVILNPEVLGAQIPTHPCQPCREKRPLLPGGQTLPSLSFVSHKDVKDGIFWWQLSRPLWRATFYEERVLISCVGFGTLWLMVTEVKGLRC